MAASAPRCWGWRGLALLFALIARLPQPVMLALATLLRWPTRWLLRSRWPIARVNFELCFPGDDAATRSARMAAHQRAMAVAVLELLRAWFAPAASLRGLLDAEGLDQIEAAQARGEGVLLLFGHFLHMELCARFLALALARPINCVVRRQNRHPCVEALIDGGRRANIGPTFGKTDTHGMVRTLRRGGLLAYAADQDFRDQQVFVPFFGVPAATLAVIPKLLRAGRACVRFVAMHRSADGRYRLRISDPGLDAIKDAPEAFACAYMKALEGAIGQAPEQYLWIHRRFKTGPGGRSSPYPV